MASVLHKDLECKVAEAQVQEDWRSCSRGSETNPNFQLANKLSQISPQKVKQSWLINTVYRILVNNNKGRGGVASIQKGGGY